MGKILSRFRKQTTKEQLESIERDIKSIHEFRVDTQQRQKKFVGALLFYSVITYIIGAIAFYFYYFPDDLKGRLLYSVPLIIFPLLVWLLKRCLHWYYNTKLHRNETRLTELLRKKRKILDDVMETETYNIAKELLEKYDPDQIKKRGMSSPEDVLNKTSEPELRQRQTGQIPNARKPSPIPQGTPLTALGRPTPAHAQGTRPVPYGTPAVFQHDRHGQVPMGMQVQRPPGPPMPRPVLPRDRSLADRVIEYLVGDGPSNRYALICRQCQSHNGMALREEFEYIAFRCCYCYYWNPARKQRPSAPRLPEQQLMSSSDTSRPRDPNEEGSGSSEGDSESEDVASEKSGSEKHDEVASTASAPASMDGAEKEGDNNEASTASARSEADFRHRETSGSNTQVAAGDGAKEENFTKNEEGAIESVEEDKKSQ